MTLSRVPEIPTQTLLTVIDVVDNHFSEIETAIWDTDVGFFCGTKWTIHNLLPGVQLDEKMEKLDVWGKVKYVSANYWLNSEKLKSLLTDGIQSRISEQAFEENTWFNVIMQSSNLKCEKFKIKITRFDIIIQVRSEDLFWYYNSEFGKKLSECNVKLDVSKN